MDKKTGSHQITQKVLEMVAIHYQTTPEVLKSAEGDTNARKVVMYTLKEELGFSARGAREAVNKKYDNDAYLAVKKIKALLKTDSSLATMIEDIKTEVLMLSAMPGKPTPVPVQSNSARQTMLVSTKPLPTGSQPEATSGNTAQVIGSVQKAVTNVFLGADLLQSRDPAAEVMLAKDAVVFLVWDDFPRITQAEILSAFHLDQDGLYRAVGRISVTLKEDGSELKKKLRAVRASYFVP